MSLENRRLQSPDITGVLPEHVFVHASLAPAIGAATMPGLYFAESASQAARRQLNNEAAQREVERRKAEQQRGASGQQDQQ